MKKKLGFLSLILVAIFTCISVAKAEIFVTLYNSYLELGRGASVTGQARPYEAGKHSIHMAYEWSGMYWGSDKYSKIRIMYQRDSGNACTLIGDVVRTGTTPGSFYANWGQQAKGNYFYYFTTKVDNHNYGGFKFHYVAMGSEITNYTDY